MNSDNGWDDPKLYDISQHTGYTTSKRSNQSGGGGGGMEDRIARLEDVMNEVRIDLKGIEKDTEFLKKSAFTKEKAYLSGILGLAIIFSGGWWIVQQYLAPILGSLGG